MSTGATQKDRRFFLLSSGLFFAGVVLVLIRQAQGKFLVLALVLFVGGLLAALRGAHYWPFHER